jgi:tetratricopeptide (TPR) repeat protein
MRQTTFFMTFFPKYPPEHFNKGILGLGRAVIVGAMTGTAMIEKSKRPFLVLLASGILLSGTLFPWGAFAETLSPSEGMPQDQTRAYMITSQASPQASSTQTSSSPGRQGINEQELRRTLVIIYQKYQTLQQDIEALRSTHDKVSQENVSKEPVEPKPLDAPVEKSRKQAKNRPLNQNDLKQKETAQNDTPTVDKELVTQLRQQVQALEGVRDKLLTEVEKSERNSRNQEQLTQLQALQKDMQAKLNTSETTIQKQQQTLQNQEQVLKEKEAQLQELQSEIAGLKSSKKGKEVARAKQEGLIRDIELLKSQIQAKTAQQASFETQLSALQAENEGLKNQLETFRAQKITLENKLNDLQATAAKPEKKTTTTGSKSAANNSPERQALLKDVQAKLEVARTQLMDAFKTINNQNQRVAALQEKLKNVQKSLPDASASVGKNAGSEELKIALQDKEQEINMLRARVQDLENKVPVAGSAAESDTDGKPENRFSMAANLFNQGKDLEARSLVEPALEHYREAASQVPEVPQYSLAYAQLLLRKSKLKEASQKLNELMDVESKLWDSYNRLGALYIRQGQYEEAYHWLEKAIPVAILNNYATSLKKLGKLEEAEAALKLALNVSPQDSDLYFNLGNLHNSTKNWAAAKDSYQKAIALKPSFSEAHYNLGLVYFHLNEKPQAIQQLETFLKMSPNAANRDTVSGFLNTLKKQAVPIATSSKP